MHSFLAELRAAGAPLHRVARCGAVAIGLAAGLAGSSDASTYYVDNQSATCSNTGPGTEAQPYCTISAAVSKRGGAGVTIVVRPGLYREQIYVSASGTAELPFVIRAEGPGVIIDGADDFGSPERWVGDAIMVRDGAATDTEPMWLAPGVSWSPDQVFLDGVRLARSNESPDRLPLNAFTWRPGEGLYVNLGGVNPGTREIRVGRRSQGFHLLGRSWVTIEGFEITGAEDRGISVRPGCTDILLAQNRISFVDGYGIRVAASAGIRVEENVVSDCHDNGIALLEGTTASVVRNNESHRNAHATVRTAKGIYLHRAPGNTIVGNRLYDNQDSGLQINAGSNGCLVFNNLSWNNGDHGYDHLDAAGTIHLNNVAYGNYKDGYSIEADSPGTQIYNCISVENGLTTNEFNLWVNPPSAVGFVSDYNIFWNSTGQAPIKFVATVYPTLAGYQYDSGQDAHSHQKDPMFVDGAGGNFSLMPGSPAIDAGTSAVPFWPATDVVGRTRLDDSTVPDNGTGPVSYVDIGAFEYWAPGDLVAAATPQPRTLVDERMAAGGDGPLAPHITLSNAFPNPSRGAIEFAVDVAEATPLEWAVYDVLGREVWSEHRALGAGRSVLRWDGAGRGGEPAGTGVYLMRARIAGVELTRRLVRL